jgi:L-alanine-DL-glutamate epimerase-like enolase superfamily enzyme
MMKIVRTTAIPLSYRLPEGKTVRLGVGATTKRDTIIVRVETDQGLVGYGGAPPGRSPGAVASLVNSTLNPLVAGMDACDVVGVWARVNKMQLSSHGLGAGAALAVSGIDMALWDIRGKVANMLGPASGWTWTRRSSIASPRSTDRATSCSSSRASSAVGVDGRVDGRVARP